SQWRPACAEVGQGQRPLFVLCLRPPSPSFAGLVVLAGSPNPIPSRTRPLNFPAPMVLSLKTWKSRSLPGLPRTFASSRYIPAQTAAALAAAFLLFVARA